MGWIKDIRVVSTIVALGLWIIPLIELSNLLRGIKRKDVNTDNFINNYEDRYKLIIVCIILACIFSLLSIVISIINI